MNVLAVPTALDVLRRQLAMQVEPQDVALPLRALQLRGLSKLDVVVHIERLRATNDATNANPQFEENCLLALDIVQGALPRVGLNWDARHDAASLLPRCLSPEDIEGAFPMALVASDLLPPRPTPPGVEGDVARRLADAVFAAVMSYELFPVAADFIRAPKGAFTTRPAAVLSFPDRVVMEALTASVEPTLGDALPDQVVWPRRRRQRPSTDANARVLDWESDYVVKADITNFYDSIEHSVLAVFLTSHLGLELQKARAIEAMLSSIMAADRGLPQGPPFSDALASAYLLPLDRRLTDEGTRYVRFADDYYFPAHSLAQGRQLLHHLETLLGEIGLTLNTAKTQVMRRATYEAGTGEGAAVRRLKQELAEVQLEQLEAIEEAEDAAQILERAGVPEETTWDLLYHRTIDVDDVVAELVGALGAEYAQAYAMFFRGAAVRLRNSQPDGALAAVERLAYESLAVLTRSNVDIRPADLALIQTWFPGLTPAIVRYLVTGRRRMKRWVRQFITDHLVAPSGIDWVDAWMCHGASQIRWPSPELKRRLREILQEHLSGPLTQAEALRALAGHGELQEPQWREAFGTASPALRSEIVFAGLASLETYPWLKGLVRDSDDPRLGRIARALEAPDQES